MEETLRRHVLAEIEDLLRQEQEEETACQRTIDAVRDELSTARTAVLDASAALEQENAKIQTILRFQATESSAFGRIEQEKPDLVGTIVASRDALYSALEEREKAPHSLQDRLDDASTRHAKAHSRVLKIMSLLDTISLRTQITRHSSSTEQDSPAPIVKQQSLPLKRRNDHEESSENDNDNSGRGRDISSHKRARVEREHALRSGSPPREPEAPPPEPRRVQVQLINKDDGRLVGELLVEVQATACSQLPRENDKIAYDLCSSCKRDEHPDACRFRHIRVILPLLEDRPAHSKRHRRLEPIPAFVDALPVFVDRPMLVGGGLDDAQKDILKRACCLILPLLPRPEAVQNAVYRGSTSQDQLLCDCCKLKNDRRRIACFDVIKLGIPKSAASLASDYCTWCIGGKCGCKAHFLPSSAACFQRVVRVLRDVITSTTTAMNQHVLFLGGFERLAAVDIPVQIPAPTLHAADYMSALSQTIRDVREETVLGCLWHAKAMLINGPAAVAGREADTFPTVGDLLSNYGDYSLRDSGCILLQWPLEEGLANVAPEIHHDIVTALPVPHITSPQGVFNIYSYGRPQSVKDAQPQLMVAKVHLGLESVGPEVNTTTLQYYDDDFIFTCLHAACTPDDQPGGIIFDIFDPQHLAKLNTFLWEIEIQLRGQSHGDGEHLRDRVWDGTGFLSLENLAVLAADHSILPTRIVARAGDTVIIPACCPFQMRNLSDSIATKHFFLSPWSQLRMSTMNNFTERFEEWKDVHSMLWAAWQDLARDAQE